MLELYYKKIKEYLKSSNFVQDLILSITPSLIFGVLFYSNNSHLVHFDDSVFRFLRFLSLLFFVWILLTKKIFFLKYGPFGFSFAFCFIVLFNYSFYGNILIYVLTLLFSIIIYLLRKHIQVIYIFFLCILLSQSIQGYFKYEEGTIINISKNFDLSIAKYQKPLKKSYSVYYLLIDSYPSYKTLITQDKLDNSEFMNWLEKKGFSINKNAYSNYGRTYTSMQATFQMKHNYYKNMNPYSLETPISRYVMAGANPVMGRFYNNGFSVYINPYGFRVKRQMLKWNGKIEKKMDLNYMKHDIYWFIMYFNHITKTDSSILDIMFKSTNSTSIKEHYYIHTIKKINVRQKPVFTYIHFHLNNDYTHSVCSGRNDKQTFIKQIECANQDLKKSINYIFKNNPNSIIILQADHSSGSMPGDLDVSNIVQRRFGILFAVRWPEECKYLGEEKYTPVNLFPRVFACLNGEKPDYQNMAADDSYLIGIWSNDKSRKPNEVFKVIENNEILPEFK